MRMRCWSCTERCVFWDYIRLPISAQRRGVHRELLQTFCPRRSCGQHLLLDNAPELLSAARVRQWRRIASKDYISQSNAVAERTIRSIVEGTRVSFLQSGLHHQYWPHAARHWCMSNNIAQFDDEDQSPWELRFGERFKGPIVPFGCKIDYSTGPRKRVEDDLRFDPTSAPGIFIGYILRPGVCFGTNTLSCHFQVF